MTFTPEYRPIRINRIRLEFKVEYYLYHSCLAHTVLIESDWNLKFDTLSLIASALTVLIESDWNLKDIYIPASEDIHMVLIESDWNLK